MLYLAPGRHTRITVDRVKGEWALGNIPRETWPNVICHLTVT